MNKEKTMEVLRGMKFMQRKEEAKRRSLYESEHRGPRGGAGGEVATGGGRSRSAAGPVLLFDTSFPTASYALSRRSFSSAPASVPVEGDRELLGHRPFLSAELAKVDRKRESEDEDLWADEGDSAGSSSVDHIGKSHNDDISDPTAPTARTAENKPRFYPGGAIRAPKLPKKLTESVASQGREQKRRKMEDTKE